MSSYKNGSIIGVDNTPTTSVASGIWDLNSVRDFEDEGVWPLGTPAATIDYVDGYTDTVDRTTYTFASVALGATGKDILIGVIGVRVTTPPSVVGVSALGVGGTKRGNSAFDADDIVIGEFFTVEPGGSDATSGDIVVEFGAEMLRAAAIVWRLSASSLVPTDDDASSTDTNAGSFNVQENGAAAAFCYNHTVDVTGCTGLTFDEGITIAEGGGVKLGAASGAFASAQTPLSVDFSPDASQERSFNGVAFR